LITEKVKKTKEARQAFGHSGSILDTSLQRPAPSRNQRVPLREHLPVIPIFLLDQITMRIVTSLALCLSTLGMGACSGSSSPPGAGDTISQEAFVQAYYELRREALRSPSMEIGLEGRDSILDALQLAEADLIAFAEVWGGEGEVMLRIWEEVDSLLRGDRTRGRGSEGSELEEDPNERAIDFRGVSG
jgi:hypothetical protein